MSSAQDTAELFKALAHPARVMLLRSTWNEARSGEDLAQLLNLSAATVSHHLAQLDAAGLMTAQQQGHHRLYQAQVAALAPTLAELLRPPLTVPDAPQTEDERYRAKVLRTFMKGSTLISIPAQRKKRDVILEVLRSAFEPGRAYPESEVNALLGAFHPDFFTLRRELIMRGWLEREKGVYRRPPSVVEGG